MEKTKIINIMEIGDKVIISPDLTSYAEWAPATVIDVDNNPSDGLLISARTENGSIFKGKAYLFKPAM